MTRKKYRSLWNCAFVSLSCTVCSCAGALPSVAQPQQRDAKEKSEVEYKANAPKAEPKAKPQIAENPAALLKQVEKLAETGALYQAREQLTSIVKRFPDNLDVNLVAARLYRQLGFSAQSIQYYQRVRRWRPLDIEPLVALSQLHLELLDADNALWLARMAVNLEPRAKEARLALGEALLAAQSLKNADAVIQALMRDFPADAEVLYLAYRMHKEDGDFAKARLCLQLAIAMDKAQLRWRLDLSDACVEEGDFRAAKTALKDYLSVEPDSTEALEKYAQLLEHNLHDYFGAIDQYRAIQKLDPVNVAALTGIERCRAKQNDIAAVWRDWVRSAFSLVFDRSKTR